MLKYVAFAIALPSTALSCDFCSSSAVLSESRADCFEAIFEDRMSRLERSSRGFVQVNLDSCASENVGDGSRSTVGTMIGTRSEAYADGGNLILSAGQMTCLRKLVQDLDGTLDPGLLVQIPDTCPTD